MSKYKRVSVIQDDSARFQVVGILHQGGVEILGTYDSPTKAEQTAKEARTVHVRELNVGDIVEVQGWIMFAKLDAGRYRIKNKGTTTHGIDYYDFAKPKGKKTIVRHDAAKIDYCLSDADNQDINKIFKVS